VIGGGDLTWLALGGTGTQIVFDSPRRWISIEAKDGGVFWVRPRGGDTATAPLTSPIPGGGGVVVKGWLRVGAEVIEFGRQLQELDFTPAENKATAEDRGRERRYLGVGHAYGAVEVWCETAGTLTVTSEGV
jgi:hypothetical protein